MFMRKYNATACLNVNWRHLPQGKGESLRVAGSGIRIVRQKFEDLIVFAAGSRHIGVSPWRGARKSAALLHHAEASSCKNVSQMQSEPQCKPRTH
jgi:hypothetical protein